MSDDQEYYACKWLVEGKVSGDGKSIVLSGTADCEHHLVEDAAILMKKIAAQICGAGHGE